MTNNETMTLLITEKYPQGIEVSELESINLAVAAIAGWTEIELWNTYKPEDKSPNPLRVYQGTNAAHPELGIFIPKYTESLDAIYGLMHNILAKLNATFTLQYLCTESRFSARAMGQLTYADTPALALCKLLIKINPALIAPLVFEAEFV